MNSMLFDYIISNPPYQKDASSDKNNTAYNIFHLFYYYSLFYSSKSCMIFPGGRWMQLSSKSTEAAHIIYPTVESIVWYPNDKDNQYVFPHVILPDGLSIVSYNKDIMTSIVVYTTRVKREEQPSVLPLTKQGVSVVKTILQSYDNVLNNKFPRMFFGLRSYFVERNPHVVSSTHKEGTIKAFLADDNKGSAKRVRPYYIDKDIIQWNDIRKEVYEHYKVCISQANASKLPGTSPYFVVENNSVVGETWLIVGHFPTEEEAVNYKNYLMSTPCSFLLEESKGGKIKSWGLFVPDLEDYTNSNKIINWDKSLDAQLEKLFSLYTL